MRFRFRTLLIVMALIALALGIGAPYYQRYRAICLAKEAGVAVIFEDSSQPWKPPHWTQVFRRVEWIKVGDDIDERELRAIWRRLGEVRQLTFSFYDMNGETATAIGQLSSLEKLDIGCAKPTPEELRAICNSRSLREIEFSATIRDEHFEALGKSQSLREIALGLATDRQLRLLSEIPQLECLRFYAADMEGNVSCKAIEALLMRHPRMTLRVNGAYQVNEEWWAELQKRFPESQIQAEQSMRTRKEAK